MKQRHLITACVQLCTMLLLSSVTRWCDCSYDCPCSYLLRDTAINVPCLGIISSSCCGFVWLIRRCTVSGNHMRTCSCSNHVPVLAPATLLRAV